MIYTVRVKFDSSGKFFLDSVNNEIIIFVSSAPVKGKANKEIIRRISNYFGVEPDSVTIIRGLNSKTKIIEVSLK